MRRIAMYSLLLVFCLAWGLGCGADPPPTPEERGNAMQQKNVGKDKGKDKATKKGILAED